MAQETLFLELVQKARTFHLRDDQLQVLISEQETLTFERRD